MESIPADSNALLAISASASVAKAWTTTKFVSSIPQLYARGAPDVPQARKA